MSLYRALERWLDGRLQDEVFAARWHAGIALAGLVAAGYHVWAAHRHARAARYFDPSPCRHVPPR